MGSTPLRRPLAGRVAVAGAVWLWIVAAAAVQAAAPAAQPADPGAAMAAPAPAAPSAEVLAQGKAQFEAACGACHGANGRGGRGGAPDLLTSPVALDDGVRFRDWVRKGSPEKGMPGFPLDDTSLDAVRAHLVSLAGQARRMGDRQIAIVGDPGRGRAYFEGAGGCTACHSLAGDFAGIGSRYPARVLQGRIVLPRGNGVHPGLLQLGVRIPGITDGAAVQDAPRTVTVSPRNGPPATGVLLAISDFDVSLRDASGAYRSFARHGAEPRVQVHDPAQWHVDHLARWSDDDLHDVTAFLLGQKVEAK